MDRCPYRFPDLLFVWSHHRRPRLRLLYVQERAVAEGSSSSEHQSGPEKTRRGQTGCIWLRLNSKVKTRTTNFNYILFVSYWWTFAAQVLQVSSAGSDRETLGVHEPHSSWCKISTLSPQSTWSSAESSSCCGAPHMTSCSAGSPPYGALCKHKSRAHRRACESDPSKHTHVQDTCWSSHTASGCGAVYALASVSFHQVKRSRSVIQN